VPDAILRWWRRRHPKTCAPNVVVGYADPLDRTNTICVVELYSCGDKICRCGGTKRKGFLDA